MSKTGSVVLLLGLGGMGVWYYTRKPSLLPVPDIDTPTSVNTPVFTIEELGQVTSHQSSMKRGIRNNNPGNIRHGDDWQGMSPEQTDDDFVQFTKPEWGIRAMVRVLRSYARRNVNTVASIITTWAPDVENDTGAYISHVAQQLGVSPHDPIPESALPNLLAAIIKHENGVQPYSFVTINLGISLA